MMYLLYMSFGFAIAWLVYEIIKKELTIESYILSWMAFCCGGGACLMYPGTILFFYVIFMLTLSIGTLIIVNNNFEDFDE